MIGVIEEWCTVWEMRVNHFKCGVMEIGVERRADDTSFIFLLSDAPLPIVRDYTYLGCKLTWDLDLYEMASATTAIGAKTLN